MKRFTLLTCKSYLLNFYLVSLSFLMVSVGWGQVTTLAGWDFNGLTSYGQSPLAPNTSSSNLTIGGLTRSGFGTSGTAATNAWGGTGNGAATITLKPSTGYVMNLSQVSAYNIRRSSTGATTGQWSYSLDGTNYTNIGTAITWGGTSSSGNAQSTISLSGILALQNISSSTTVYLRISNTGATTGTWYLNNFQSGNDFSILGEVSPSTPNVTPMLTTTGTLSTFQACPNTQSAEQSFQVNATNLASTSVSVSAPSGFGVSLTSGGTFNSSVTLTPSSGTLNNVTVYVAMLGGTSSPSNGNITVSATNDNLSATIACSGTISSSSQTTVVSGPADHLTISQIYPGGGNSGATYNADMIELYNPTSSPISLTGYSLQYASSSGIPSSFVALPSGIVQPYSYFLLQTSSAGAIGSTFTSIDQDISTLSNGNGFGLSLSSTSGKVYLVYQATPALLVLSNCTAATNGTLIDFVGYGTTSTCFEGSAPVSVSASLVMNSIQRKANGAIDSDQNNFDFVEAPVSLRWSGSNSYNVAPSQCSGGNIVALATTTGSGSTNYQWYQSSSITTAPTGSSTSGWSIINGQTSRLLTLSNITENTTVACMVTDACGAAAWASGIRSLSMLTSPSVTTHPTTSNQNGLSGAIVSVAATGAGLSYQWYTSTTATNEGGTIISGATSSSYTPAPASNTYYYCVVTGTCGSITSNASGVVTGVQGGTISPASCGATLGYYANILAMPVGGQGGGASGYKFKLVEGSNTIEVTSNNHVLPTYTIPGFKYGVTYAVSVALKTGNGQYGPYGTACNISTTAPTISNASCNSTVGYYANILATPMGPNTGYKFKLVEGANTIEVTSTNHVLPTYTIPNFKYGVTYTVSVAIKNSNNQYGGYGPTCAISTTAPTISNASCNSTVGYYANILATPMGPNTGYKFKLEEGGNTIEVTSTNHVLPTYTIPGFKYGVTYTVSVALKNANNEYGGFGPTCTINTTAPTISTASCGATVGYYANILATPMGPNSGYKFKLVNGSTTIEVESSNHVLPVYSIPQIQPNTAYTVSVAIKNASGAYGGYGTTCTVTYAPSGSSQGLAIQDPQLHEEQTEGLGVEESLNVNGLEENQFQNTTWTATATRNPFAHSFQIKLNGTEAISTDASFTAQLTDMSGKVYSQAILSKEQLETESFGEQLAPGMYLMTLRQGEELRVIRVVKR